MRMGSADLIEVSSRNTFVNLLSSERDSWISFIACWALLKIFLLIPQVIAGFFMVRRQAKKEVSTVDNRKNEIGAAKLAEGKIQ